METQKPTHTIRSLQSTLQHICQGPNALTLLHNSTAPPPPPLPVFQPSSQMDMPNLVRPSVPGSDQWQAPGSFKEDTFPTDRANSSSGAKYYLDRTVFMFSSPFSAGTGAVSIKALGLRSNLPTQCPPLYLGFE